MEMTYFGDISPRTAGYASKELLKRGAIYVVTDRFGQSKPLPKNSGKTITFRRYEALLPATAPLAEGVTPAGQKLRHTDVPCTIEQYGDMVMITDVIQDTHEDPVLNESITLCAEQIKETVETIRINALKGGTTVFYSGGATTRATVDGTVTRGDLRKITRYLNRMKAQTIGQIVKATPKVATEPVAPAFFAMCHTDLDSDIRNLPGFVSVEKYSESDKALAFEIGKCENIRFICTPMFTAWSAAGLTGTTFLTGGADPGTTTAQCDVYPIIIVGKDAYGIVPLQGENVVSPSVLNPNKPDKSDPLGQRGYVSWKLYQSICLLNQTWIVRYEVACTANPT
jgi:N4-gp56 family major capsid protein